MDDRGYDPPTGKLGRKVSRFLFERRRPKALRRLLAAVAAPPVAMALLGLVLATSLYLATGEGTVRLMSELTFLFMIYGSMIAYLGILFVGLPVNLLLGSFKAERGISYVLAGAVGGFVPILVAQSGAGSLDAATIVFSAVPGALTATIWWLLASNGSDLPEWRADRR